MSDTLSGALLPPTPSVHPQTKVPRARLIRLVVQAEICPQVVMRVLGLIAQFGLIPLAIAVQTTDDHIRIEVEIDSDGLTDTRIESLSNKLAAIVMVTKVALI